MITVGFVNELRFLSESLKAPISLSISCSAIKHPLNVHLNDGMLTLKYAGQDIWEENVVSDVSMFGVESCHTILQVIILLDKNDDRWREFAYFENRLDK